MTENPNNLREDISGALAKVDALENDLRRAKKKIESLENNLTDALADIERLELKIENAEGRDPEGPINDFLDLVSRPVGELRFEVQSSKNVDRALLSLYDAIGRRL